MDTSLLERITLQEGVIGGKPTIRGLRIAVSDVLEMLASGMSAADIIDQHPLLTPDDIKATLLFAADAVDHKLLFHAA
ncbi:MAG: DUF433 domain-containing protein [Chitinophagaceae bacterium]|nr:DUF433 domain-containing protein [Chitinophagaceae bacterium]